MAEWRERLPLSPGETLEHVGSKQSGFMQETDEEAFRVITSDGSIVGTVTYRDHTSVRGFKRTLSLEQRDLEGRLVYESSWRP